MYKFNEILIFRKNSILIILKYIILSVKQFQKDKKLKVTGKVDYKTAKKLKLVS